MSYCYPGERILFVPMVPGLMAIVAICVRVAGGRLVTEVNVVHAIVELYFIHATDG